MTKNYGPVLLHWDGKLTSSVDFRYDGGLTRLIKVQRDTSYTELLSKIRLITGQFCDGSKRKLICKWPIEGSKFVPVGIIDSDSTQLMLGLFDIMYTIYIFVQADNPIRNSVGEQATRTNVLPPSENITPLYSRTSYNQYGGQERHLTSLQMPVQTTPCKRVEPRQNNYGPVLLHWGGKLTASGDIRYDGGQTRLMKIQRYILYTELLSTIYPVTGYSRDRFNLKLTCKWPVDGSNFVLVNIVDNDSTELMLSLVDKVYTIQLFAEADRVCRQPVHNPIGGCAANKKILPSSTNITPMSMPTPNNQHGCQERRLNIERTQVQYGVHLQVSHPPQQNKDFLHEHKKSSAVANDNDNENGEDTSEDDFDEREPFTRGYAFPFSFDDEYESWDVDDRSDIHAVEYFDIPHVVVTSGKNTWFFKSFSSKEDLQLEVQRWSLARRVQYTVKAPTPDVLRFKCIQGGCKWRLRAYEKTDCALQTRWKVLSYRKEHSCISPVHLKNHPQCSSIFICDYILPVFQANFTMSAREIMELIKLQFRVNITYGKAYYAMKRALKLVKGNTEPCVPPSRQDSPSSKSSTGDGPTDFQDEDAIEDVLSCSERNVRARTTEI